MVVQSAAKNWNIKMEWLQKISPCPRPVDNTWTPYTYHNATPTGWFDAKRVIYEHELILFRSSDFIVEIDGTRYDCPPDSFLIIPPGKWNSNRLIGPKTGFHYWSHFDWVYQGNWKGVPPMTLHPVSPQTELLRLAPDFVPNKILRGTIPRPAHAYELHEELSRRLLDGAGHERLIARALLLELLLELLTPRTRERPPITRNQELGNEIRMLLDAAAFAEHPQPTIPKLLQPLGMSTEHLGRLFRSQYGVAPLQYLQGLQMVRAKLLLRDTKLKIKEIAWRTGFSDQLYFSRVFRKYNNITPSLYRLLN